MLSTGKTNVLDVLEGKCIHESTLKSLFIGDLIPSDLHPSMKMLVLAGQVNYNPQLPICILSNSGLTTIAAFGLTVYYSKVTDAVASSTALSSSQRISIMT